MKISVEWMSDCEPLKRTMSVEFKPNASLRNELEAFKSLLRGMGWTSFEIAEAMKQMAADIYLYAVKNKAEVSEINNGS